MADDHDTIVIRAPAGTKTRWVRQSQAQHRKLSEWIVDAVDRPMSQTNMKHATAIDVAFEPANQLVFVVSTLEPHFRISTPVDYVMKGFEMTDGAIMEEARPVFEAIKREMLEQIARIDALVYKAAP